MLGRKSGFFFFVPEKPSEETSKGSLRGMKLALDTSALTSWSVLTRASLVAHVVKYPSTMQETWVWPLNWKDPLKKEMAPHSSVLAWRTPRTAEPGATVHGSQRVGHDRATKVVTFCMRGHFPLSVTLELQAHLWSWLMVHEWPKLNCF